MARKYDIKGGNGGIKVDLEAGTVRKYLRNTSSQDKIPRFRQELKFFQEVSKHHIPNIVEIVDVHFDEADFLKSYVEMKKYDGSLYDMLDVTKGNVRASLELILPIIKVLHRLSEGTPALYHRDIKPDNILFLKENDIYTLYLTDFGTCFLNDGSERLTPETMAVGPRMYIAPEYETGRVEEVTEKGDIFSIGKVIWCMINGNANDFMPSNFWFVDEYNLTKRFPDNPDMIAANTVIASCLNIKPEERCDYPTLIMQIETILEKNSMTPSEETQHKVNLYREKRRLDLMEIKEKNKLLVNSFSQCYIQALEKLQQTYPEFELIQQLNSDYRKKSKDGNDFTTANVEKNSTHYLYSDTIDRIYLCIKYNPAQDPERYSSITIEYRLSGKWTIVRFYYTANGAIVFDHKGKIEALSVNSLINLLDTIVMEYIDY